MLSRVADNLYWMSRYLERIEHTARLIDVNLNQMLDQTGNANQSWDRLLDSLHMPSLKHETQDAYSITRALTFDAANNSSIVSCIAVARENARQVREQISSEMWEHLNRLYLRIKGTNMEKIWHTQPHRFLTRVKEGIHLFQGITDSTMSHSEGWHFIRVGRFLERTSATAALLDVHFSTLLENREDEDATFDYLGWVGLLRSCAAFEAYCKVYTANLQPNNIAEFLLLNAESPRSVRFASAMMQADLQAIARSNNIRNAGRTERLVGRLRAALDYDQLDEIMSSSMHSYLENIQRQCAQIHTAIYQTYISYPVDVALMSRGASQA
jgi:uncharacterized alpha-E superfamily protein